MADINIVRKTPAILPWLIALVLVLLGLALWVLWHADIASAVRGSMRGRSLPAHVAAYRSSVESSLPIEQVTRSFKQSSPTITMLDVR